MDLSQFVDIVSESGPVSPDPGGLLEAIYFTHNLLPTYYLVIASVILLSSIQHFRKQSKWKRDSTRIQDAEKSGTQSLSCASRTLTGDEVLASKTGATTEVSPLLESTGFARSVRPVTSRLWSRFKAFLVYQPRPVPALTAPANILPANGVTSLVIVFFFVNVFYLIYGIRPSLAMIFAYAHRAGLCFVVNLPVLYILGAKNNQPLKWLTGWSYEKINLFHRRLGEWMIVLALLHCASMFTTWYTIIRPQGDFTLGWFLTQKIVILGNGAVISFLLIWISSTGQFRETAYELFLASHIGLQIAALVLVFFHHHQARPYCGAAVGIWVLDRVLFRMLVSSTKLIATLVVAEDGATVLLYCDIKLNQSKIGDIRAGWKAGQHVFLSIPAMSWYHAFQAHPFTIASPAPPSTLEGADWPLQLIIRCKDGFSKDLLEYAKFHQHVEIHLDGPYGSAQLEDAVRRAKRVCFIAGGSGITVTYPLAWSLLAQERKVIAVSNRTVYEHGRKIRTQVKLHASHSEERRSHIWIRQQRNHGSWITTFPADSPPPMISSETSHCSKAVDLVSRKFDTRQDGYEARPDVATEIRSWLEGSKAMFEQDQQLCIVVSGPAGLVRDARNCAAALLQEGYTVDLHVEKFGW